MNVEIKGGLVTYTHNEITHILNTYPEIEITLKRYGITPNLKYYNQCVRLIFVYSKYVWFVNKLLSFGAQIDFHLSCITDVDVYVLKNKLYDLVMINSQPLTTSSGQYLSQYNDELKQCLSYEQLKDYKLKRFYHDLCFEWLKFISNNSKPLSLNDNWVRLPK